MDQQCALKPMSAIYLEMGLGNWSMQNWQKVYLFLLQELKVMSSLKGKTNWL